MSIFALVVALAFCAIWDPLTGFSLIATTAVPVVIVVYMIVSVGCFVHYRRLDHFNPLLHAVLRLAGIVLFALPLYYQFIEQPPTYPVKAANWIALVWAVIGLAVTGWLLTSRPGKTRGVE